MKSTLLFIVLLSYIQLNAQMFSDTRAIVIGISDYQDDDIPDLNFAHKDAEAFADYLRSPAGGELSEDNLRVLINEEATGAQFATALTWLVEETRENDRVIIYFSGHGDVESKSISQPGYLLCWDSPAQVYMAGGALNVRDLNEIVSTLSIEKKAEVILITDACRAGKLSGSTINGPQATTANLAKQFSNEVKILSCQPNEYSVEGKQWGEGHGAFSYHLINGLYGKADFDKDQRVILKEINRYLEDTVSLEVAPEKQYPMTVGDKTTLITNVFPDLLSKLNEDQKGQLKRFSMTTLRGIEKDVLSKTEPKVEDLYDKFKKAIQNKKFLEPADDCAEFYYQQLIKNPKLKKLHASIRRNYAAALQDDAQIVLNSILKTEMPEYNLSTIQKKIKYHRYPQQLERAAELIGKDHYIYAILKSRKHFFQGYIITLENLNPDKKLGNEALNQFRQALEWQADLPHVYWQMSEVYGYRLGQLDSMKYFAQKAMDLSPNWVLPYYRLIRTYSEKERYGSAEHYLKIVTQIDSTAAPVWNLWGLLYSDQKRYKRAESSFRKAIELDSTYIHAYNNLGLILGRLNRYKETKEIYEKIIGIDSTYPHAYYNLGFHFYKQDSFESAKNQFSKILDIDSTFFLAYAGLSAVYDTTDQQEEAERILLKYTKIAPDLPNTYYYLFQLYRKENRLKEAEIMLGKTIELNPLNEYYYYSAGSYYQEKGNLEKAELLYKRALEKNPQHNTSYYNLACIYSLRKDADTAFYNLEKAIQNGYKKDSWMKKDKDLIFLRKQMDQWQSLILKYFSKK